jgi:hypothetical protein
MATKSVYQIYDTAALKHYGLEGTPEYGVLSSSGDSVEKVMVTSNDDVYKKIKSALETNTLDDTTFRSKKKAFILPLCPVSQDRIKAALKEHKITVTNDYETADFIITHDEFYRDFRNGDAILTTAMLANVWNYEILKKTKTGTSFLDNWIQSSGVGILFDDKVTALGNRSYMCDTDSAMYDRYMITGLALNLAYQIELGNYGVIDAETIVNASANKITLTEELVKDLIRYMNSSNVDDREIAGKIIPTIDYTCNFHLLWEFAQESYSRMYVFNKNKDVQYWMETSGYSNFKYKEALDMIKWLEEHNKLDNISFKYLERIVRKEIRIENRDLYIFKVELKPQYKKYYGKQSI